MPALQHLHPMIVHFPIVLIFVLLAQDAWSAARGQPLSPIAAAIAIAAAAFAALAAILGDAAAEYAIGHGVPDSLIETHEGLGMTTAMVLGAIGLWRLYALWRRLDLTGPTRNITLAAEVAALMLVVITAGYGGNLVFAHGVNVASSAAAGSAAETD